MFVADWQCRAHKIVPTCMLLHSDDMLEKKGSIKICLLYPCTDAYQMLWGWTMNTCLAARRPDTGICLSRLLLLDIWHDACGP